MSRHGENMRKIKLGVVHGGITREYFVPSGKNLLETLQKLGYYIPVLCSSRGACGKCRVKILAGESAVTRSDAGGFGAHELASGFRLACMAFPEDDLLINLENVSENEISAVGDFRNNAGLRRFKKIRGAFAVAVDIGTTTLAFALVNLETSEVDGRLTIVNRQREFGADVISRIVKANQGRLKEMGVCVKRQINEGILELCRANDVEPGKIVKAAVAANTTMLHILLGLSCETLGIFPFTPVTLERMSLSFGELLGSASTALKPDVPVEILPGISTYVGADIVSGILFADILGSGKTSVLLDIGTNGEIAVIRNGKITCAATAAGPAFEGGNIRFGTGSVPGAISGCRFRNGEFEVTTIGGRPPIGICGSGVIDIVSELLKNEIIDETGRLSCEQIAVAPEIFFTQKDVRELQLAKSAIRSGVDLLLEHTGTCFEEIDRFYVAGGFGYHVNFDSAVAIGLIPPELAVKIELVGNSSLGGAVRLLTEDIRDELAEIISASQELPLSADKRFNALFVENMVFPECSGLLKSNPE